jgi:hypothetical protein
MSRDAIVASVALNRGVVIRQNQIGTAPPEMVSSPASP